MTYAGTQGMPDNHTQAMLDEIENEIDDKLHAVDGYLNIGRQTGGNMREVYYACKEFRKPASVADEVLRRYKASIEINHHIYKDKYWRTFERFTDSLN